MNPVFADLPVSVFEVMSQLAREHDAVNLGQGFPDDAGPEDVRRKAADAVVSGWNQSPPRLGRLKLRQPVPGPTQIWRTVPSAPDRESLVPPAATEAVPASLLPLTGPGHHG